MNPGLPVAGIIGGIGAVAGAATEAYKGFACGHRGWKDLGKDAARGAADGLVSSLAGVAVDLYTDNAALAGAAASEMYDVVDAAIQGKVDPAEVAEDTILGGIIGPIGEAMRPPVRGG
jgi:hypothetical protein